MYEKFKTLGGSRNRTESDVTGDKRGFGALKKKGRNNRHRRETTFYLMRVLALTRENYLDLRG